MRGCFLLNLTFIGIFLIIKQDYFKSQRSLMKDRRGLYYEDLILPRSIEQAAPSVGG